MTTQAGPAGREVVFARRWAAALVMVGAVLMGMIDITIVNVALPTIGRELGASGTQLEWVVSAYMLAFAAVLITAGSLGDLVGRKRVFGAGIAVFGLASLAAGLAQDPGELIAARVVQGAAAAAMVPQLLAIFRVIFTGGERGQAFGVYGAVLGFASALGLILGGVLTDADLFGWGWRTIFLINVPIALIALVSTVRVVPETRHSTSGRPDVLGAVLLTVAIVAIAYPLLEGRAQGWPAWVWLLLAAGLGGLLVLGIVEDRRQHARLAPLLRTPPVADPRVLGRAGRAAAFSAGLQGFFLIFALWIQLGMGFSPLGAGLTTVAFSVGSVALAPVAVGLAQRYGRLVLTTGGQFATAQQLGGALGVAIVGSVFFSALNDSSYTDALTTALPVAAGLFAAAAALGLVLPRTAVAEEDTF